MSTPSFPSRLPAIGTNVFSVMSALALEHDAVNLGQGFPDFGCDPALVELVHQAMLDGHNQYPPMPGAMPLRAAIAAKVAQLNGRPYQPDSEITVTNGASEAIMSAILCSVGAGDEVIVIEPAYDCYLPAITLAGAAVVTVSMQLGEQGYTVPWPQVAAALSPRTRMVVINSPHNPTGAILRRADLDALADILRGTDVLLLSDEVYEHMVYDGQQHCSVASHPDLAERAFLISSFGKTYHVTGWKVGYVLAPAALTAQFRKVHQYNVFTVNTPMQYGIAAYMADPAPWQTLAAFYQRKRDLFRAGLANTRFTLLPCDGTYFQCVRYDAISTLPEMDFARWLSMEARVAAIPLAPFYASGKESGVVRFCFAKQDATLALALERLARL